MIGTEILPSVLVELFLQFYGSFIGMLSGVKNFYLPMSHVIQFSFMCDQLAQIPVHTQT